MTKGEQALKYLGIGWAVMPVSSKKLPLVDWKKYINEKPTPEQVEKWWQTFPDANIGIITGKVSGLTVVDVDDGADYKQFPRTKTVKTGNNGFHLYYKYHKDYRNKAGIMENVDIRGDGGYVVAPGSVHENGNKYEFIDNIDEQPFPIDMFAEQKKEVPWDEVLGEGAKKGERNQTATQVIGRALKMYPTKLWETEAWEFVKNWNLKNKPPLDLSELETTFRSIAKRELPQRNVQDESDDELLTLADIAKQELESLGNQERYSTGFPIFDEVLEGGLGQGDLIVVSGKSGHGKTTFAQTMGYHLNRAGISQLWFSYELPVRDLWKKFKDMRVKDNFLAIAPKKNRSGNVQWLEDRILEAVVKNGTKVVFIDHLGFLTPKATPGDMQDTGMNFSVYLGQVCRQLKTLAMEQNIVIVLLAHVRKTREELDLDDLAHSSGIGQESDLVIMVERLRVARENKKQLKSEDPVGDVFSNFTRLSIVKNRRTGQNKFIKTELKYGKLQMVGEEFVDPDSQDELPWENQDEHKL